MASALVSWATYHRSFPTIGRMRVAQGLGQAITQVILGLFRVGPIGLILGDVIGRVVGAERLFGRAIREVQSTRPTRPELRRDLREHWGFARVMTAASLLSTVSLQVAFLLIPVLFDLESAGQYYLAYRMLVLPASLVAAAVSQVFFGEASHRRDDPQRLRDLAFNATVFLFAFSIPTYGIATVAGSALIQIVFGEQWALAGSYAQIMAPSLVLWAVAHPISTLLLVGRRERESLAFVAGELALKVAALVAGAVAGSLTVGLIFLAFATVAINIAALWRFLRVPRIRLVELVEPVGRILLLTAPWLALVAAVLAAVPVALLPACAIAWGGAFALAIWSSREARALLSGSHD
jgi:O-antigen/teichoic acid export membrane protein